jgi:hypothetical protein
MTIVAGFRVQDGIVMCGDTMYTGNMKIHQSKLISATLPESVDTPDRLSIERCTSPLVVCQSICKSCAGRRSRSLRRTPRQQRSGTRE